MILFQFQDVTDKDPEAPKAKQLKQDLYQGFDIQSL
jgi:hypothetical protein